MNSALTLQKSECVLELHSLQFTFWTQMWLFELLARWDSCQSNSGFILLSHYTKWYYVDRDKCLRRQCSKMTLFQGKFNLESWTHFDTTEHRFSPIRAFHSRFAVGHVHVDFASCLSCLSHCLSRAGRNVNLKGKCAILMNIVFWTFCHLQGKNQ